MELVTGGTRTIYLIEYSEQIPAFPSPPSTGVLIVFSSFADHCLGISLAQSRLLLLSPFSWQPAAAARACWQAPDLRALLQGCRRRGPSRYVSGSVCDPTVPAQVISRYPKIGQTTSS